jgi:hypothetical protein
LGPAEFPTTAFHPAICPESVAKRKVAAPEWTPSLIWNDMVGLKILPVGPDGVETTSGKLGSCGTPLSLYNVAWSNRWSDIQNGLELENAIPHGFSKFKSVLNAIPGTLEVRLVWR